MNLGFWKASLGGRLARRAITSGIIAVIGVYAANISTIIPNELEAGLVVAVLMAVDKYLREKLAKKAGK